MGRLRSGFICALWATWGGAVRCVLVLATAGLCSAHRYLLSMGGLVWRRLGYRRRGRGVFVFSDRGGWCFNILRMGKWGWCGQFVYSA